MLTQSRRPLDNNAESDQMINRSTMREIKQDLNRAKQLSLFSAVLKVMNYKYRFLIFPDMHKEIIILFSASIFVDFVIEGA